jgi:phenylpropionate dioxygenase-like ring-hydroxylating dioxygenase large terminal subunit
MTEKTVFIKNCWYVAAWSHEIEATTFLARTITGIPLMFWRDANGAIVAFEDRCCHRAAPLSMGRREADGVRCMYHGMLFDRSGKCIEIPSQDFIPPAAKVRTFPVVEKHKWVWVWMGDPARADQGLIPDTHYLDDPGWRGTPGYFHYEANYLLIADNLLDFSHLAYVHEKTLGGSPKYAQIRPGISRTARQAGRLRRVLRLSGDNARNGEHLALLFPAVSQLRTRPAGGHGKPAHQRPRGIPGRQGHHRSSAAGAGPGSQLQDAGAADGHRARPLSRDGRQGARRGTA